MCADLPVRHPKPNKGALNEDSIAFDPGICMPCAEDSLLYGDDEDVETELADVHDPIVGLSVCSLTIMALVHCLHGISPRRLP